MNSVIFGGPRASSGDRITADGSSGFKAEPGRYHLYLAHSCPWAHRTMIFRGLKKLESVISVAYAVPGLRKHGWTFEHSPRFPDCTPDTVNGSSIICTKPIPRPMRPIPER